MEIPLLPLCTLQASTARQREHLTWEVAKGGEGPHGVSDALGVVAGQQAHDLGNGASVAEVMQLDKKAPAPLVQADVPMSEARAVGEEVPQCIGPEQQSIHAASGEAHGAAPQKQQQESAAGVQKHGGPATDAQSPVRAVAEQAAQETLAALNADSAAKQATPSAQAAAPTAGSTAVSRDAEANAADGSAIAIAERAVVQQGHAPAGASAEAVPESAKPSGPAAAMEAIEATAKQLGGPVNSTNDQAMPDAEAQP